MVFYKQPKPVEPIEKICTKCKLVLALDNFYVYKSTRQGKYRPKCKVCEGNETKARYAISDRQVRIERRREYEKTNEAKQSKLECRRRYIKTEKGKRLHIEGNKRYVRTEKGRKNSTEKSKKYQKTDKGAQVVYKHNHEYAKTDMGRENIKRSYIKRKYLLRGVDNTLTTKEWTEIKIACQQRCVYCLEVKPLTKDHVIPLSKGGTHTKENVLPACKSCNSSKHDSIWEPNIIIGFLS